MQGHSLVTTTILAFAAATVTLAGVMPAVGDGKQMEIGEGQKDRYALTLGEQTFDPLFEQPEIPVGWAMQRDDAGPDLRLVQFVGPTRDAWLAALKNAGLEVIQYIHPYTYVVWGASDARDALDNMPAVRWTGEFHPAYRVLPQWRNLPDAPQDVKVLMYRGADTDAIIRGIRELGGRTSGQRALNNTWAITKVSVMGPALQQIAQIPGVYSVQLQPTSGGLRSEMSNQVCVNNVNENNIAFPGYLDYLADVGFDGNGVIIANVDGGIDQSHPDLVDRIIACEGETCGGSDSSGHGTHTAGIMAADGSSGVTDSFGFLRGLGMAPGADIVEQVYSPFFQDPGGMLLLMTESQRNDASLSGNSWGPSGFPQGYDNDTMQCDIGVRDADPDEPGNQPLSYVLSFMNGGGGTSTQGTPDEAKNIFTIGSTKMQNGDGSQIPDINDLSSNTAHGPALDGRTIPHMVAPGCDVDSTYSGFGGDYNLLCGTSMASPHVSGAIALFIEYYRSLPMYEEDPSPALVKAAFLPVSHDLAGNLDADGNVLGHPFDSKQGWGRMNVPAVIDPPANSVRYFDQDVTFDETGEEWSIPLSPIDPSQPVRIMLVWTDAPGHGLGGSTPAWNNDLDLIVEAGGSTFYGNNFGGDGFSVDGGAADEINNTEGVFLGPVPPGSFNVRVVASNINSDGVPNFGDETDQDFALVAYNVAQEPGFVVSAAPSSDQICTPDDASYAIELIQIMGYEEEVTLSATGLPDGASVSFANNPITPPAATTMTITDTDGIDFGDYSIEIVGTSVDLERTAVVGLDVSTAVPDMSSLLEPANGEPQASLVPTFEWTASAQAALYDIQVATDAGFSNVVIDETVDETTYAPADALDTVTEYFWRVRGVNTCGAGDWSMSFSFTTQDVPPILLVDDDDNSPDVRSFYTDTLDSMGFLYDVWDTDNSDDEPTVSDLAPYELVIWFTGDEFGGACGPGSTGEQNLAEWLDNGGCLFLSSQDYHWDRDQTPFMTDYLGIASIDDDEDQDNVTGEGDVFGDLGSYTLDYPFTNFSDALTPGNGGALAFSGDAGDAAVTKDGGAYRTVFLVFPLEAISEVGDRVDVLTAVVDWCGGLAPDCPEDLNGSGDVDVEDLLQLLAAWGESGGAEDLDGSGTVDVGDLLLVLAAWGACE